MLYGLLITLHVIVATILVLMVLVQKGKGADIGAAFGGASQTLFGPRGAQSFMAKLTTGAAIIFMITSLLLAFTTARKKSVMEGVRQEKNMPAPAAPLTPPVQSAPVAPAPAK